MSAAFLFQIDLPIREAWRNAEELRVAVIRCLETVYDKPDACELYGMVVGELVENALKYGWWGGAAAADETSRLRMTGDAHAVQIEVIHAASTEPGSDARLFALLAELKAGPNAEAVYHAKIQEVATRAQGSGGLGLARIAFEAACQLSATRLPGGRLSVCATSPAPA